MQYMSHIIHITVVCYFQKSNLTATLNESHSIAEGDKARMHTSTLLRSGL